MEDMENMEKNTEKNLDEIDDKSIEEGGGEPEEIQENACRELEYVYFGKLRRLLWVALITALVGGLSLGLGYGIGSRLAMEIWIPRISSDRAELRDFSFNVEQLSTRDNHFSYADVISLVEPAVVRIRALRFVPGSSFRATEGHGTGMVFHETLNNYYILTNAHVVAGADQLFVSFYGPLYGQHEGSRQVPANIHDMDYPADVAVISVSRADAHRAGIRAVPLASIGDSDALRPGDVVLAIGNALGDGISTTNGIISALNRSITIDGHRYTVLQINAAINHGNSGGPLVNLRGEVIGMNTAKLKRADVEGIGFSIPSNIFIPIVEELMRGERAAAPAPAALDSDRAVMGIVVEDGYFAPGALITFVFQSSPAQAAGLMVGDIITEINGRALNEAEDLLIALAGLDPGDLVSIVVLRNGTERVVIEMILASARDLW